MPLLYITGIAGAGKSTVCRALEARRYKAYDTDKAEHGLAAWTNTQTGLPSPWLIDPAQRTDAWHREHAQLMIRPALGALAVLAATSPKPIYVCGMAANSPEMLDLFDDVVCLTADETTIMQRVAERSHPAAFGKTEYERREIITLHESTGVYYQHIGALMIDASLPPEEIVDAVLTMPRQNHSLATQLNGH